MHSETLWYQRFWICSLTKFVKTSSWAWKATLLGYLRTNSHPSSLKCVSIKLQSISRTKLFKSFVSLNTCIELFRANSEISFFKTQLLSIVRQSNKGMTSSSQSLSPFKKSLITKFKLSGARRSSSTTSKRFKMSPTTTTSTTF